ncbi:MAG: AmmeMemoRadiSam system radical SAM enzyme [Candidatus Omnitrophota bacterium]|nr:AmmeMemoRadiSam system radical SAM enzyme [Candidatus Omnitrophota bacterium]
MRKLISVATILFLISILPAHFSYADKPVPRVASFWNKIKDKIIQCVLCPRKCVIDNGQRGLCTVRVNKDGVLYTLGYGNPVAVHIDPIEKKPFFNVLPGTSAFSIAVAGCNMRCLFCQNWQISQARPDEVTVYDMPPEMVVSEAIKNDCPFIVYTYTEPTVFYEYMLDISKLARSKGLKNGMHTCGYINQEPLKELLKYMDAVNVDLKGFNEKFYQKMGAFASLEPVLNTLKTVKKEGVWLEITNLIIPGLNDDPKEIRSMCEWIRDNLGADTPVHFSRFMPSFRLQNLPPTPVSKLEEAYKIAKDAGLDYVYIGNVPGHAGENTYCPQCKKLIVGRIGYRITENNIKDKRCKFCGRSISGIWAP